MKNGGCAYGQVTRQMVIDVKEDIKEIRNYSNEIRNSVTNLSNHYSRKIPAWATIVISVLVGLLGALGALVLK